MKERDRGESIFTKFTHTYMIISIFFKNHDDNDDDRRHQYHQRIEVIILSLSLCFEFST